MTLRPYRRSWWTYPKIMLAPFVLHQHECLIGPKLGGGRQHNPLSFVEEIVHNKYYCIYVRFNHPLVFIFISKSLRDITHNSNKICINNDQWETSKATQGLWSLDDKHKPDKYRISRFFERKTGWSWRTDCGTQFSLRANNRVSFAVVYLLL